MPWISILPFGKGEAEGIFPRTAKGLPKSWRKKRTFSSLEHVVVSGEPFSSGSAGTGDGWKREATVGVCLEYENTREYFFNTTAQGSVPGVSGSCRQVAAGLHAALWTVIEDPLAKRVNFVEDLLGTTCERLMMENLPMQRVFISKKSFTTETQRAQRRSFCFSGDTEKQKCSARKRKMNID